MTYELFQTFCLVPQLVHFAQRHIFQRLAYLYAVCLDIIEATDKLIIGFFETGVGVELIEAGGIDKAEEKVAQLGLRAFLVEPYIASLVLYAVCLDERGQGGGHP